MDIAKDQLPSIPGHMHHKEKQHETQVYSKPTHTETDTLTANLSITLWFSSWYPARSSGGYMPSVMRIFFNSSYTTFKQHLQQWTASRPTRWRPSALWLGPHSSTNSQGCASILGIHITQDTMHSRWCQHGGETLFLWQTWLNTLHSQRQENPPKGYLAASTSANQEAALRSKPRNTRPALQATNGTSQPLLNIPINSITLSTGPTNSSPSSISGTPDVFEKLLKYIKTTNYNKTAD